MGLTGLTYGCCMYVVCLIPATEPPDIMGLDVGLPLGIGTLRRAASSSKRAILGRYSQVPCLQ